MKRHIKMRFFSINCCGSETDNHLSFTALYIYNSISLSLPDFIFFPYCFVPGPCAGLSWPPPSAFERTLIYRIVSYRPRYSLEYLQELVK